MLGPVTEEERTCLLCSAVESEHSNLHEHPDGATVSLCERTNPGGVYEPGFFSCVCGAMLHTRNKWHICLPIADGRRLHGSAQVTEHKHNGETFSVHSQWNGYRWESWFTDDCGYAVMYSDTTELDSVRRLLKTRTS